MTAQPSPSGYPSTRTITASNAPEVPSGPAPGAPSIAQPSPDLPDSLRRDRKPATAAGEDLYREAAEAFRMRYFVPEVTEALKALDTGIRAAVDRVAELVRADMLESFLASYEHTMADQLERLVAERNQARADLAAMTARAESAEAMYDQARAQLSEVERWCQIADHGQALKSGIAGALGALVTSDIRKAIREAGQRYDETGPLAVPSARVAAEPATVEGHATRGSEGVSGGAS